MGLIFVAVAIFLFGVFLRAYDQSRQKIRDLQKLETVEDLNIGLPTASHKEL